MPSKTDSLRVLVSLKSEHFVVDAESGFALLKLASEADFVTPNYQNPDSVCRFQWQEPSFYRDNELRIVTPSMMAAINLNSEG